MNLLPMQLGQMVLGDSSPQSIDEVIAPYVGVFAAAFVVSLLATPVMRKLARNNGITDNPDNQRKLHREPIPYLGGVAIFLGWMAGMAACLFAYQYNQHGEMVRLVNIPISIVFGAAVITLVGLFDDVYGSSPRVKLGGQLLAAAALASEQVGLVLVNQTLGILGVDHAPYWICYTAGAALIALFVLGGTNAMNLIDGLDGLAGGSAAIMNLGFLAIAVYAVMGAAMEMDPELHSNNPIAGPATIVICLATLGAVLGFLPYNFNPASIFMGDAGSLLLGFLAVSTILMFAHTSKGPGLVLAGLIVFSLPIIDTTMAIMRRKMRGVSISSADKMHLHHQVLRHWQRFRLGPGASVKLTALSLYAFGLALALLGLLAAVVRVRYSMVLALVFFGFVAVLAFKSAQRIVRQEKETLVAPDATAQVTTTTATTTSTSTITSTVGDQAHG